MPERLLDLIVSVCRYALTNHTIEFRCFYAPHPCDDVPYMVGPVFSWQPAFHNDGTS